MGNKSDFNCFDYIGDQIRAYVVNRLANASCTTAQLVGTFSLIVDQLSIAERSLTYVLDALYREKVIDFTLVNNTRLYSLLNFDKDYIFELNIEKVEELIAEYKLPYFSDHRKDVQEPLYFEARKNRTCIYINAPLSVPEKNLPVDVVSEPVEAVSSFEPTASITDENLNLKENVSESFEAKEYINSNVEDSQEIIFNTTIFDDNSLSNAEDETSLDSSKNDEIGVDTSENVIDENHNDLQDNFNDSGDISDVSYAIFEEENELNSFENSSENIQETVEETSSFEVSTSNNDIFDSENLVENIIEDSSNQSDEIATNEVVAETDESNSFVNKSNFDSIDFTSFNSYSDENNYSQNVETRDDSMDAFEQKFAEALAKAMAQTTQNEASNPIVSNEDEALSTTDLSDTSENTDSQSESENGDLPSDPIVDNSDSSTTSTFVEKDELNDAKNFVDDLTTNDQKSLQQVFADEFVFTELQENVVSTVDPEEERERQERALRMMEEILENKNSVENAEPTPEIEFQFVEINDKIDTALSENTAIKNKPEQDELTLYIKEQERINNYDWHKRLQRALVDVLEDPVENEEKPDEFKINSTLTELKTLMATKNYTLKSYPSHESKSFYTENYVFSNRIALSTAIFTYLFMLAEIFLAFFLVDRFINKGLSFYIITAVALLAIPLFFFIKYGSFRDKRKPAKFFFGLSLVTSMMIYINLMVLVVLVAFFVPALQVEVSNLKTMILTIFYPAGLFLGIPISVCIYAILYRSKRYHLH